MAYVSMSDRNITHITNRIEQMRSAEMRAQVGDQQPPAPLITPGDPLFEHFWGQHLHLRDQVPEHWLDEVDSLRVKIKNADNQELLEVRCEVKPATRLPPKPKRSRWDDSDVRHLSIVIDGKRWDERFRPHATWAAQRTEIFARWQKVIEQISGFLKSCKSLNEAVKLYPDIMNYVPGDLRAKLGEKTEKKAKDVSEALNALAKIDHEIVTTSTVLARMAGEKV